MKAITAETTIEDLQRDPKSYGLPTFEEFKKNRNAYMGNFDDAMASIINGPLIGRKDLRKIKFQVHGVDIKPDHLERALSDYNHTLSDLEDVLLNRNSRLKKKIDMVPLGGGKFDVVLNLLPKTA